MIKVVKTSSGSVYEIDEERKLWSRSGNPVRGARDFQLPTSGEYQELELNLGERMVLFLGVEEQVLTSRVTQIQLRA
jgi:hypothetical protein